MKKKVLVLALLSCFAAGSVSADVSINGFASIKGGMATSKDKPLYGYDDDLDFKNESLFALQIKSDLGDKLSVTGQLMGRGSKDFDVGFEWAFISYELTENTRLNAGRLRTPLFKYSDFRDVGYAYDWLRVPQGVYGLNFNNIEGISLYRTAQLGDFDSTLQLIAGRFDGMLRLSGQDVSGEINNLAGLSWEVSKGNFSGRAAYFVGKISVDINNIPLAENFNVGNLFNAFNSIGLNQIVKSIDVVEESGTFTGLGVTYDNGIWVLNTEFTQVEASDSFIAERQDYFISVSRRFNSITPYILYEVTDHTSRDEIYTPFLNTLPAQLLAPLQGLVGSQTRDAKTWNIGARYDFHPSAAFKVQYSSEDNNTSGVRSGLIAVGIDLVF